MVWGVLGMEGFRPFCVRVDGGCHASERGEGLVRPRSGEGDVFGREDSSPEGDVLWEVVGRKSSGDLGGDRESRDPNKRGVLPGCRLNRHRYRHSLLYSHPLFAWRTGKKRGVTVNHIKVNLPMT